MLLAQKAGTNTDSIKLFITNDYFNHSDQNILQLCLILYRRHFPSTRWYLCLWGQHLWNRMKAAHWRLDGVRPKPTVSSVPSPGAVWFGAERISHICRAGAEHECLRFWVFVQACSLLLSAVCLCLWNQIKLGISSNYTTFWFSEKTESRATRRVAKHRFELRRVVSFMKRMILSMILYKTGFQSRLFIPLTKCSLGIVLFLTILWLWLRPWSASSDPFVLLSGEPATTVSRHPGCEKPFLRLTNNWTEIPKAGLVPVCSHRQQHFWHFSC